MPKPKIQTARELLNEADRAITQVLKRLEPESDLVLCVVKGLLKASLLSLEAACKYDFSLLDKTTNGGT